MVERKSQRERKLINVTTVVVVVNSNLGDFSFRSDFFRPEMNTTSNLKAKYKVFEVKYLVY